MENLFDTIAIIMACMFLLYLEADKKLITFIFIVFIMNMMAKG